MIIMQHRSSQRYPKRDKILANSLPKEHSSATFYSKEKSSKKSREMQLENRPVSIKDFIDVYFEEQARQSSNKMPIIKRRHQFLQTGRVGDRKRKELNLEEQLSKSVTYQDVNLLLSEPLLPPPHLRYSVSVNEQLPSIHEQTEGIQDEKEQMAILSQTSQLSFLKRSSSLYSDTNPQGENEQRRLTYENQLFCIYILLKDRKPVSRVKEYKDRGIPFMEREIRMKNYGITSLWKESKYNHRSFVISLRPPIKDQLSKIMPDEANPAQLKIKQKVLHSKLLANNCQELCILLKNFCIQLKKVQGKVLNNKINPSNLFLRYSNMYLAQWGYSSFREEFTIREGRFQKRRYGVLKGDDWFVSPQYLAPEIIRQILGEEIEVWGYNGSADIWSLGLTFFEFITLIPIWITAKCALVHRPNIIRSGVLASPGRDLQFLLKKQGVVQRIISRLLTSETSQSEKNEKLFKILVRMVEPDLKKRISLDEIIESL